VNCDIDPAEDVDLVRFFGNADDVVSISVNKKTFSGVPASSVCAQLFAPDGSEINVEECSPRVQIRTTLPVTGTYSVLVSRSGNYGFTVNCLSGSCVARPSPSLLGYTAVKPCRIVDTRYGIGGAFSAGETRGFHTYGDVSDQNGAGIGAPAGYPTNCPFSHGEPHAAHLNVTVVPRIASGERGYATLWPWDTSRPSASWINYQGGNQIIANAGAVKTTISDSMDPDVSIYSSRAIDLIIDVLGYYTR
jgi:hypothetical protein